MKLTILGGSAAGPNPGQGCSGYLVESGVTRVVLDLGPGTLPELRKHVDFRSLDAIVLSHLHVDHMLDLLALRFALAYNPVAPASPIPLWLPPGGLAFFQRIATTFADPGRAMDYFSVFTIAEYDPGRQLSVGRLEIQFQRTVHYVPCWAMRLSNGHSGDLVYTADTGPTADLASFAQGTQVLLAEGAARPDSNEPFDSRGHLTPIEAGNIATAAGALTLVLSHLWYEHDPYLALCEASDSFAGKIVLATPGLRLQWE